MHIFQSTRQFFLYIFYLAIEKGSFERKKKPKGPDFLLILTFVKTLLSKYHKKNQKLSNLCGSGFGSFFCFLVIGALMLYYFVKHEK